MRSRKKPWLLPTLQLPTEEQWLAVLQGLGLDEGKCADLKRAALQRALEHAEKDIETRNGLLEKRPTAGEIRRSYRDFDKAFALLESVLARHADKGTYCLPYACGEATVALLLDQTLTEVTGKKPHAGVGTTLEKHEREDLALEHGPEILAHVIRTIRAPLRQWLEKDKANYRGGRPGGTTREIVVINLVEEARAITGVRPTASLNSRFVRLCKAVLAACELPINGLEKLIERAIRKHKIFLAGGRT